MEAVRGGWNGECANPAAFLFHGHWVPDERDLQSAIREVNGRIAVCLYSSVNP